MGMGSGPARERRRRIVAGVIVLAMVLTVAAVLVSTLAK